MSRGHGEALASARSLSSTEISKNFGRNAADSARCGEQHPTEGCTNPDKCANCLGAHPAYHKDCSKWILEKEVQQVEAKNGASFVQAQRIVTSEQATSSAKPSAAAVISRSLGSQNICGSDWSRDQ